MIRNANYHIASNTPANEMNMRVVNWEYNANVHQDLVDLLTRFGPNLQKFAFVRGNENLVEIRRYLELIPDIKWLHLDLLNVPDADTERTPIEMKMLRELEVEGSGENAILSFLNRLSHNVLTRMKLVNVVPPWIVLKTLLSSQKKVKHLALGFEATNSFNGVPSNLLSDLDLDRLVLADFSKTAPERTVHDLNALITMVTSQIHLTHLQLCGIKISDEMMKKIVTKLPKLIGFTVNITNMTEDGITLIGNLEHLKKLSIESADRAANNELRVIANLDNNRLEALSFLECFRVNSETVFEIANSAQNLKKLFIEIANFNIAHAVMQYFKEIKSLSFLNYEEGAHIDMLLEDDCENGNLEELYLNWYAPFTSAHIEKFVKDYPNLKKFEVSAKGVGNRSMLKDLRSMLDCWKQLTHLAISNCTFVDELGDGDDASRFRITDLGIFLDHNNLKFVAIRNIFLTNEEQGMIRSWYHERFPVIEFNTERCNVAVNESEVNMILASDIRTRNENDSWLHNKIEI